MSAGHCPGGKRVAKVNVVLTVGFSHAITPIIVISAVRTIIQQSFDIQEKPTDRKALSGYHPANIGHLDVCRLHVEGAAWADTYAAIFANFALTPNCVCHVQPVRAEQPSEFGALARQGRVTGYPSDNHRITIFLSGLFLCFLNVGDRENASAVRAFGCGV